MTYIVIPTSGGGGGGGGGGDVNIHDAVGNNLTSQVNGTQRALDVGVNVAGVQIDPRAIRALTASDVISANIRMDVSGTPTAIPGNSLGLLTSTPYATYIGTMTAPPTGVIISSIDCANYRFVTFEARMSVGTFTAQIQGSNDGINWSNHPFGSFTPNAVVNTTTNVSGIYSAQINSRYLRWNVSAIATGTLTVTAIVSDNTRTDYGGRYVSIIGTPATSTFFAGRTRAFFGRLDASTSNITNAAYTQIVASTAAGTANLWISNSTGQPLVLATGAAGSETDQIYIPNGGWSYPVNLAISASVRISLKSLNTTASTGEVILQGMA